MPRYWPFNKYPGTDYETFNWDWLIGLGKKMKKALNDLYSDTGALHQMVYKVLGEHPEWVTTVMDGSLTLQKFANSLKLRTVNRYITPEEFGAVGDGITDDTSALQECCDNGGYIYLKNSYKIYQGIDLPSNTHIFGKGTIIDDRAGTTGYEGALQGSEVSNIIIDDISYKGPGAGSTYYPNNMGIYFDHSEQIKVNRVKMEDIRGNWGIMANACDDVEINRSIIDQYSYGGIGNLNDGNDFTVKGCRINNVSPHPNSYAIALNAYDYELSETTYGGENLKALYNTIIDQDGRWEQIDAHGGTNVLVSGNVLKGSLVGIRIMEGSTGELYKAKNVTVTNNIVECTEGIHVGGENVICTDNKIICIDTGRHNNYGGISAQQIKNGIVNNNIVKNAYKCGIRIDIADDLRIGGNIIDTIQTVDNRSDGILVQNGQYNGLYIENNTINGADVGVRLPDANTSAEPYIETDEPTCNDVRVPTVIPAITGSIPVYATAEPNQVPRRRGKVIYNGKTSQTIMDPAGWIYTLAGWRAFGNKHGYETVYTNTINIGDSAVTFDRSNAQSLAVTMYNGSAYSYVIIANATGTHYYPITFSTTVGYARFEIDSSGFRFLACSDNNARVVKIEKF